MDMIGQRSIVDDARDHLSLLPCDPIRRSFSAHCKEKGRQARRRPFSADREVAASLTYPAAVSRKNIDSALGRSGDLLGSRHGVGDGLNLNLLALTANLVGDQRHLSLQGTGAEAGSE
jgi:hypothetical protein